jgi:hypothetical protein
MLTISGKALGKKKPLFADFSIPYPPELGEGGAVQLRDLLSRIVRHEVEAFRERQEDRKFVKALTERQISEQATRGKIDMGGRDLVQKVDTDEAIRVALEAFEDGLFLVIIDGSDYKTLESEVFLLPDSKVGFVRLTMLAGG